MTAADILFWGGLAIVTAAVVLWLVSALSGKGIAAEDTRAAHDLEVYRDQLGELERDLAGGLVSAAAAESARLEIERRLLAADQERMGAAKTRKSGAAPGGMNPRRLTAVALAVTVPLATLSLYGFLGSPGLPGQPFAARQTPPSGAMTGIAGEDISPQEIEAMVERLGQRLEDSPGDPQAWRMLARSYLVLGRLDDADWAYEKAAALFPDDADLLVDRAIFLVITVRATGEAAAEVPPEAIGLLARALEISPLHPGALWLMGLAAAAAGNTAQALELWRKLRGQLPQGGEDREILERRIGELEAGG